MTLIKDVFEKWLCPEHAHLPIDEQIGAVVSLCQWLMGQVQTRVEDTGVKVEFVVSDGAVRDMLRTIVEKREPVTAMVPIRDICIELPHATRDFVITDVEVKMVTLSSLIKWGAGHFNRIENSFIFHIDSRLVANCIFFYLYYSIYNITDYDFLRDVAWLSSILGFSEEVRSVLLNSHGCDIWKDIRLAMSYVTYSFACLYMMSSNEYALWVKQWVKIFTDYRESPDKGRLAFNGMGNYIYDVCDTELRRRGYFIREWLDINEGESFEAWHQRIRRYNQS